MKLRLKIDAGDARKASAVAMALAADAKPRRGTARFSADKGKLLIELESNDDAAMRAAMNSSIRLADACFTILR